MTGSAILAAQGGSKSVQVLCSSIEAVLILTLRYHIPSLIY